VNELKKIAKEYHKRYYKNNRSRIVARSKDWYYANRDEVKQRNSVWQKQNKEKRKIYCKKYRDENKDKSIAYFISRYYKDIYWSRECGRKQQNKNYKRNPLKYRSRSAKWARENPDKVKTSKKKYINALPNSYLKKLLKQRGRYDEKTINQHQELLQIKKIQVIIYRINKHKNKKNENIKNKHPESQTAH
jgi:hypothetical protein